MMPERNQHSFGMNLNFISRRDKIDHFIIHCHQKASEEETTKKKMEKSEAGIVYQNLIKSLNCCIRNDFSHNTCVGKMLNKN
jgi:hypothetical protein